MLMDILKRNEEKIYFYILRGLPCTFSSYDRNNLHKKLQNFEVGTIKVVN